MCQLCGIVFPYCNHGIQVFFRCPTYAGPAPAVGELLACAIFQDMRTAADFPCSRCSGADIYRHDAASPYPESEPTRPIETMAQTMERARLARVASEERMAREGTTLEEEHLNSCYSKEEARLAREQELELELGLELDQEQEMETDTETEPESARAATPVGRVWSGGSIVRFEVDGREQDLLIYWRRNQWPEGEESRHIREVAYEAVMTEMRRRWHLGEFRDLEGRMHM